MWTDLRAEIEKNRKKLGVSEETFRQLRFDEWQDIEEKIYQNFCEYFQYKKKKPTWLWECFKLDYFAVRPEKDPILYLEKLIDQTENVWFFVYENVREKDKFWFYEGYVKHIQEIIYNTFYTEVYIASKKYKWLICINHHDVMFATGELMPDKLRNFFEDETKF